MPNFSIKIEGLTEFGRIQLQTITDLSEKHLSQIAKASALAMRENIKASIQRPGSTGQLERAIFAQPLDSTVRGWGVGDIDYLNRTVPYWYWINFGVAQSGRRTPPATAGSFSPGNPVPDQSSFRAGRWSADGSHFIIPKRPIQPHNYIQRTLNQQNQIIASVLNSRTI